MNYYNSFIQYYRKNQDKVNIYLLIAICLIAFYNVLSGYFLEVDDFSSILHRKRDFLDILLTNTKGSHSGGNYRPIESLSHIIDTIIFGDDSTLGRRIINLSIHIINVTLVYYIVRHLTKKSVIALIAAIIYSIHFIHSRSLPPVGWITGRSELTLTLFFLLSIFLYSKSLAKGSNLFYIFSLISFFFSLLSKELAVTLPIIVFTYTLLFPEFRETKGIFKLSKFNWIFRAAIGFGISLLTIAIVFSPGLLSFFSSDGTLQASTEKFINALRLIAGVSGVILIGGGSVFHYVIKWLQHKYVSVNSLWYTVPFFIIFGFFMILRRLVIGGFGGAYHAEGGNLFLQLAPDTFIRDLYSLLSIVWPIGSTYHLQVFELQIEYPFIFYFVGSLIMITLVAIFYILFKSKNRLLLFGFLWLLIIALPAHNIMINPWQTQTRYLYLPLAGFSLFASIILYLIIKQSQSRLLRGVIVAVFIAVMFFNFYSVVSYNSKLVEGGRYMKSFVTDMKKYKSFINDSSSFYFINFPTSEINTPSNIYITAYMNDLLNYIDAFEGYNIKYEYHMMLFLQGKEENKLDVKWINNKNFLLEGIDQTRYYVLPKNLSELDIKIKEIYKRPPFHPIKLPLTDFSATEIQNIQISKIQNKLNFKINVKENENPKIKNRMLFIYERGHFKLVPENKVKEQFTPKLTGTL